MSKVEIVLDKKGIADLLKSDDMKKEMERIAKEKASKESHIKSFVGFDRAKSIIYPNTKRNPK